MASTQGTQWHPVLPQITDPDLVPPPAVGGASWVGPGHAKLPGGDADVAPQKGGFYQEHKFAIIVAVVVLLIVVVVLFVYLTRRSDKKKTDDSGDPGRPLPGSGPEDVNLEELNRLRAMRRQARTTGAPSMASVEGAPARQSASTQYGPPNQGPQFAHPQRHVPSSATVRQYMPAPQHQRDQSPQHAHAHAHVSPTAAPPNQGPQLASQRVAQRPSSDGAAVPDPSELVPPDEVASPVDFDMDALISSLTDEAAAADEDG